jgi:hypothetical protein
LPADEFTLECLATSLGDRLLWGLHFDLQQRRATSAGEAEQVQPATLALLLAGYSPGASTPQIYRITADLETWSRRRRACMISIGARWRSSLSDRKRWAPSLSMTEWWSTS